MFPFPPLPVGGRGEREREKLIWRLEVGKDKGCKNKGTEKVVFLMSFNLSATPVFFLYECSAGLVMNQTKYPGYTSNTCWCFGGKGKKDLEHGMMLKRENQEVASVDKHNA